MRYLSIILLLMTSLVVPELSASPLDDARNAGQVVEMPSGYIEAKGKASAEIRKLVLDVNKRRKAAYQRIATRNGITIEQVAAESHKKLVKKR